MSSQAACSNKHQALFVRYKHSVVCAVIIAAATSGSPSVGQVLGPMIPAIHGKWHGGGHPCVTGETLVEAAIALNAAKERQ